MEVVAGSILLVSIWLMVPILILVHHYKYPGGRHIREAPTGQTEAVVEEYIRSIAIDAKQILKGKCFDQAPNCKQELCENHQLSLRKNCKKTCGHCGPINNKSGAK